MLAVAFLMALAAQSLDAFDDANLALTQCGFAAYRHSTQGDQTLDQFSRFLTSRCAVQIARMRAAIIDVETRRGRSSAAAASSADALIAQFRAQFAGDYARRAETEAQVRALERALREEGKSNAQ